MIGPMECNHKLIQREELMRGYCNACDEKNRTCTVCGEVVDSLSLVYGKVVKGKLVEQGHEKCIGGDNSE